MVLRGISLLLTGALFLLSVPAYAVNTPKPNVDNLAATLATAPICVALPGITVELPFYDHKHDEQFKESPPYVELKKLFFAQLLKSEVHQSVDEHMSLAFMMREIAKNSFDSIVDKITELGIAPEDYDGRITLQVYHDSTVLVLSCVDNGKPIEFKEDGTPTIRKRKHTSRYFSEYHAGYKLMKKDIAKMNGTIEYTPLENGTKVEIKIPLKYLWGNPYFSDDQRIIVVSEDAVLRKMARVRLDMISQAVTLTRVIYAEENDPILEGHDAKLLTHGKVLVSPRLKNYPLKQLRAIFHEEIEAVMQLLARQEPLRYSAIREMILSDEKIKKAYSHTFPKDKAPVLEDNLLVNDMIATAFELLLLSEDNLITDWEMTFAEGAYIRAISPAIMATKHNYFTSIFWDQYTREMEIRTATASGQKFYEVASLNKSFAETSDLDEVLSAFNRIQAALKHTWPQNYDRNIEILNWVLFEPLVGGKDTPPVDACVNHFNISKEEIIEIAKEGGIKLSNELINIDMDSQHFAEGLRKLIDIGIPHLKTLRRLHEKSLKSPSLGAAARGVTKEPEKAQNIKNIIDAADLSQDPRVVEISKDLQINGLQNFTEIHGDNVPREIRSGGGFVRLFKHENGLELIQRNNNEEYIRNFFTRDHPWFCPVFTPGAALDEQTLFELNLQPLGYQILDDILDGTYKKGETRVSFQEEQKKRITNTIRRAIKETFKEDIEKSVHGHLHGGNILVKIDDAGNLTDVKIIDWKCIGEECLPADIVALVNGEREDLKGANLTGVGENIYADIEAYSFQDQDLTGANLKTSWINWSNFNGAILRLADLTDTMALGASFIGADLRDASLVKGSLVWSDFESADLRGADLTQANLISACLSHANLAGANLTRADLRRVDLTNVDYTNAILDKTTMDLEQAVLFELQGYHVVRRRDRCTVTNPELSIEGAQAQSSANRNYIIAGVDLTQDPRVAEMAEDFRVNGLQNFTEIYGDDIPTGIESGGGFAGLFRHKNGLEIIQRQNENEYGKEFVSAQHPWFCPIFPPGHNVDIRMMFELNLETLGYQPLSSMWDGKYEKDDIRVPLQAGQNKTITESIRYAVRKTFKEGAEKVNHGHLHGGNVLLKIDDRGRLEDIKIIDWKKITKETLPVELTEFVNGKRENLRDAFLAAAGEYLDDHLEGYDFENQDMTGVILMMSWSNWANFKGATLQLADLSYARLMGAAFNSADLRKAELVHSSLEWADFENADLRGANLTWTILINSSLSNAKLANADFTYADLRNIDLTDVDLSQSILKDTKVDAEQVEFFKSQGYTVVEKTSWFLVTSPKPEHENTRIYQDSPHNILELLIAEFQDGYATVEEIRQLTTGDIPDGHLSKEAVLGHLERLRSFDLVKSSDDGEMYHAVDLSPRFINNAILLLKSFEDRGTSLQYQEAQAAEESRAAGVKAPGTSAATTEAPLSSATLLKEMHAEGIFAKNSRTLMELSANEGCTLETLQRDLPILERAGLVVESRKGGDFRYHLADWLRKVEDIDGFMKSNRAIEFLKQPSLTIVEQDMLLLSVAQVAERMEHFESVKRGAPAQQYNVDESERSLIAKDIDYLLQSVSFESACTNLHELTGNGYPLAALEAQLAFFDREKEGESLILYADDILSSTMAVDFENSIRNIVSDTSTLKNGKIILFSRNGAAAEILNGMIKRANADIETIIITEEELKETKNNIASQADEIEALVNFAKTKDARDILGLIKGPSDHPEDLTDTCKDLRIPVLMIGYEEGLYSFAKAMARAASVKDDNGSGGWFIVLRPIRAISEDIKTMHQEYLSALQALISA